MNKKRYIEHEIEEICFKINKMAFVSGARQCGKTTLSKRLLKLRGAGQYYNWDEIKFRRLWASDPSAIITSSVKGKKPLIILDELHKAKLWKRNLKGVYDSMNNQIDIIVTGSARLNVYRKGSDSLLGRYYHFRLHPFSARELSTRQHNVNVDTLLSEVFSRALRYSDSNDHYWQQLMQFGPFPEPLLSGDSRMLTLWQSNRIEKIIREDLRDLSRLPELSQVEMLASLLPDRVASPLSIASLSGDLEVAYATIKRWLGYLNELYYCFFILPYSRSLSAAIKKEKKYYLWDWSEISDKGKRFENAVASHLLKYCHYLADTGVGKFDLCYVRNKQGHEIDFLLMRDNKPWLPIEVKTGNTMLANNWRYFLMRLPCDYGIQLVDKPNVYKIVKIGEKHVVIMSAAEFMQYLI